MQDICSLSTPRLAPSFKGLLLRKSLKSVCMFDGLNVSMYVHVNVLHLGKHFFDYGSLFIPSVSKLMSFNFF